MTMTWWQKYFYFEIIAIWIIFCWNIESQMDGITSLAVAASILGDFDHVGKKKSDSSHKKVLISNLRFEMKLSGI